MTDSQPQHHNVLANYQNFFQAQKHTNQLQNFQIPHQIHSVNNNNNNRNSITCNNDSKMNSNNNSGTVSYHICIIL